MYSTIVYQNPFNDNFDCIYILTHMNLGILQLLNDTLSVQEKHTEYLTTNMQQLYPEPLYL